MHTQTGSDERIVMWRMGWVEIAVHTRCGQGIRTMRACVRVWPRECVKRVVVTQVVVFDRSQITAVLPRLSLSSPQQIDVVTVRGQRTQYNARADSVPMYQR